MPFGSGGTVAIRVPEMSSIVNNVNFCQNGSGIKNMIKQSIIMSDIDVNSADTIAKMVNPDAEVANPLWWIAMLVAIVLGVGYFLLKHYFKISILDGRPNPHVRLLEEGQKKTVIYLQKSPVADIDGKTNKRVQEKMHELEQKYPMKDLDVFNNMYLAIPGRFEEAQNYNADVKDYMNDMRLYHSRMIKDIIMTDCFKIVKFVLYGKGKKACNNLIIEVSIKGDNIHLYAADSRQMKNDKHDVEPDKNELDRGDQFYAFFPNEREDYEYGEWNLQSQPETIRYTCQNLISGCPNTEVVKPIYVDTRYEQNIIVGIRINGADIPEEGVKEELVIKVGGEE